MGSMGKKEGKYARRPAKALIQLYHDKSRPEYCAKVGMVDEIVDMTELRPYIQAFTEAVYQNPKSICPMHQMVTPRAIREWNDAHKA